MPRGRGREERELQKALSCAVKISGDGIVSTFQNLRMSRAKKSDLLFEIRDGVGTAGLGGGILAELCDKFWRDGFGFV